MVQFDASPVLPTTFHFGVDGTNPQQTRSPLLQRCDAWRPQTGTRLRRRATWRPHPRYMRQWPTPALVCHCPLFPLMVDRAAW